MPPKLINPLRSRVLRIRSPVEFTRKKADGTEEAFRISLTPELLAFGFILVAFGASVAAIILAAGMVWFDLDAKVGAPLVGAIVGGDALVALATKSRE